MSVPRDNRLPYMPGIDALRAIAVLAVFVYHAAGGWLPGGFLGVDVFFVISGYLITSLLLSEYRTRRSVNVGRFWIRRAKRLLPAVGVFIAVTMVIAAIFTPEDISSLRGDALSGLAYVANWHFIFVDQSYFEQFQRPSLFRHLWSLSVEEQFYLLWPLAFAAGMTLFGRRRLMIGAIAGALASVLLTAVLFNPGEDPSRVYFGTDTHAVGLLLGVTLALLWNPAELRERRVGRWAPAAIDLVGLVALGLLLVAFLSVNDFDTGLYRGGYLWVALITAALIAALAHPAARIGRALGRPPLLWLGLRSYSFYLWHWPVVALTRPELDISLPRGILVPLQLVVVLILADLSYRYVEVPFRGRGRPNLPALPPAWRRVARPALAMAVAATVFLIGWGGIAPGGDGERLQGVAAASTKESAQINVDEGDGEGGGNQDKHERAPRIVALGDSVMVGASDQLADRLGPKFSMDAAVGRQADDFVYLVQQLDANGDPPDALIIQMGNNGPLLDDEMEALREATADIDHVFLINDHAPVSWVEESNQRLATAAADWPHTTLIDWASLASSDGDLTWDGVHLQPAGAEAYARLVAGAVNNAS
ncbi:MAG: acyltransferase family protein [Solirubrobacterales bacterium]|nr:acyltransferase family protein [Solirubrobacterales bacterium]